MTDFKNIKHFNCSLDFKLTHLLTVGVMLSSNAFFLEVNFFFSTVWRHGCWKCFYICYGRTSNFNAMNISGSCVIHTVIVLCLPLPWHLPFISKFKAGSVSKMKVVSANADTILIAINRWSNCLFVLRFYGPVNPMGSCRAQSVYLTTCLLGRLSPLSG